ncbi:MAG: HAD hydrolase family protein [Parachlamydiaceae bacterium]
MKGIVALDIDGTMTEDTCSVPLNVKSYLEQLYHDGWVMIFITGRPFNWAYRSLMQLNMHYYLAIQNGAVILEMPDKTIVHRCYLSSSVLLRLDKLSQQFSTDYIIYSGYENQDICYYRPQNLSPQQLGYLHQRAQILNENWMPVEHFDELPLQGIASLKFIEQKPFIIKLVQQVEEQLHLHVPLNRDPVNEKYFVAQVTHPRATKGEALEQIRLLYQLQGPIIAAGDDFNDISMLQKADIKIMMGNAEPSLLSMGDIIAPPASQEGVIHGLKLAIEKLKRIKK